MLIIMALVCILSINVAYADSETYFGIMDSPSIVYENMGSFLAPFCLDISLDGTVVTDLSLEFEASENIQIESVDCFYQSNPYNTVVGSDNSKMLFSGKKLTNGILNLQSYTFKKGTFYFEVRCSVLDRSDQLALVTGKVASHHWESTSPREHDGLSSGVTFSRTFFLEKDDSHIVKTLTFTNGTTAKAGIPYELKADIVPSSAKIEWVVVDAGDTGAIITNNVLFTVGPGKVVVEARVCGGNEDGSDYAKQFTINVEAIRNLSSTNKVIGITTNDYFDNNTRVSFQLVANEKVKDAKYGDAYYIPKCWSIDEGEWVFFSNQKAFLFFRSALADEVHESAVFSTKGLSNGEHVLHAGYTTMRYNGEKWVDAGYDYIADIPFIVGANLPITGESNRFWVYMILLLCSLAGIFIICKFINWKRDIEL